MDESPRPARPTEISVSSEPEKYSIDEMISRLKTRTDEDPETAGELVVRQDGSQAIRVRKRKRRSAQTSKTARSMRARMIQVSGFLVLLLVTMLGAGFAIIYANSAPFRDGLLKNITSSSGATVEIRQFRMNPTAANAGWIVLNWPEGNVLRDLTAMSIHGEIFPASFLGKSMVGEELSSGEVTLNLRVPDVSKPARTVPAPSDNLLPVRFKRYAVPKLHVVLGDAAKPMIRLSNSEASFNPENAGGSAQLLLNRGEVSIAGWPKLRIDRSHVEFREAEVDVVSMRLQHDADIRGNFELKGRFSPYVSDQVATLAVQLESFPVAGLAGTELGRLFSGRIDTLADTEVSPSSLTFTPSADPKASLTVAFQSSVTSAFELNGFPFLVNLSTALNDKWFVKPTFDSRVNGTLSRTGGLVTISDLSLENKDRMALRGGITMAADRQLSGSLEVGVADAMLATSKNKRLQAMFGPAKDGFRWVTLKIGGVSSAPTDNFKVLYEAVKEESVASPPISEVPSFEELTAPR